LLYFVILPIFLVALASMVCVTIASRFIEPLKPAYPFIWRILLGSALGFVLANSLLMVLFLLAGTQVSVGKEQSDVVKFGYAVALLLGPAIASFFGFAGGSALGIWFAFKARNMKTPRAVQSDP